MTTVAIFKMRFTADCNVTADDNQKSHLFVHPKDKLSECINRIECRNCDNVYIGKTGRNFAVRLKETKQEVEVKDTHWLSRKTESSTEKGQNK